MIIRNTEANEIVTLESIGNNGIDFQQIFKLKEMLRSEDIPFEFKEIKVFAGYQLFYPNKENKVCDVILHNGSYGHEQGLLEIMGLVDEEKVGDEVEGYLTAGECFNRIKKHYEKSKPNHITFDFTKRHRNPSGLHNKVSYLLGKSCWDLCKLDSIIKEIFISPCVLESYMSWTKAISITSAIISGRA